MNPALQSRLCLTALVALLVGAATLGTVHLRRPRASFDYGTPRDRAGSRGDRADAALIEELAHLSNRTPNDAEWQRVAACIEHRSWPVVAAAIEVFRSHDDSRLRAAECASLRRSLRETADGDSAGANGASAASGPNSAESFLRRQVRTAATRATLDRMRPPFDTDTRTLLVELAECGQDGHSRARALELILIDPPAGAERLVLRALQDTSQRVRLVALDAAARGRWESAIAAARPLIRSPRPALADRAADLLESLRASVSTGSSDDALIRAAESLADDLWRAGLRVEDVLPLARAGDSIDRELLRHRAETYLDQPRTDNTGDGASDGPLLIALAVRAGERKLVRRLWEFEVERCDTDDELRWCGLEALARARFLAGLARCHLGDQAGALEELAAVARLAPAASRGERLDIYVRQAGELSGALWRESLATPPATPRRELVARLATDVLRGLNLKLPDQRAEAARRLDAWCGLAPDVHPSRSPRAPFAN